MIARSSVLNVDDNPSGMQISFTVRNASRRANMKIHGIYARDKIALRCFGDWTYLLLVPHPSEGGTRGRAAAIREHECVKDN